MRTTINVDRAYLEAQKKRFSRYIATNFFRVLDSYKFHPEVIKFYQKKDSSHITSLLNEYLVSTFGVIRFNSVRHPMSLFRTALQSPKILEIFLCVPVPPEEIAKLAFFLKGKRYLKLVVQGSMSSAQIEEIIKLMENAEVGELFVTLDGTPLSMITRIEQRLTEQPASFPGLKKVETMNSFRPAESEGLASRITDKLLARSLPNTEARAASSSSWRAPAAAADPQKRHHDDRARGRSPARSYDDGSKRRRLPSSDERKSEYHHDRSSWEPARAASPEIQNSFSSSAKSQYDALVREQARAARAEEKVSDIERRAAADKDYYETTMQQLRRQLTESEERERKALAKYESIRVSLSFADQQRREEARRMNESSPRTPAAGSARLFTSPPAAVSVAASSPAASPAPASEPKPSSAEPSTNGASDRPLVGEAVASRYFKPFPHYFDGPESDGSLAPLPPPGRLGINLG